jgi:hypothetical protein
MYKRYSSLFLIVLLLHVTAAPCFAKPKEDKEAQRAEKVRQGILRLGVGKDARVSLKLKDKTRLVGYISEAKSESFVIKDMKTGASSVVAYPSVTQVKGHNLSTGAKIAIGVGIVAAIIILLILKKYCDNEGGC